MTSESLTTYSEKRDPARTPEPMPAGGTPTFSGNKSLSGDKSSNGAPIFVIQEHHARALHWDFRLEHDGVLVSWALPKGLPLDPKRNHLAVHTEDHPLEYQSFEGEIPKGEYGGGKVTIWDRGTFELEKWRSNEVKVVLHGERAKGRYVLFPTGKGQEKNWMIHRMDPAPAAYETMPGMIKPMLAAPGVLPAQRSEWAFEFKWDGVRAIVFVEGGRVRVASRNDKDLTAAFPELADLGKFLGSRSAILDGEIVAIDEKGRPSFGQLQRRLHLGSASTVARRAKEVPASFLIFDVLYLDGRSTLNLPYDERRALLEDLHLEGDSFGTPPSLTDRTGEELLAVSQDLGLEGLVIKRRDARYSPGQRNGSWVKVKNFQTQEVVVGGWTQGKGARVNSLGALLVGIPSDDGLVYVGKVGTGFDEASREELLSILEPLGREDTPFTKALSRADTALAHFVQPTIVGEVQYTEMTSDGRLRHPSWRGLRVDKEPTEVTVEF